MTQHVSPVHTADAVQFLLETADTAHMKEGIWIYFRIPFGKPDHTYQGQVTRIEAVDGVYTRVSVVPFGMAPENSS